MQKQTSESLVIEPEDNNTPTKRFLVFGYDKEGAKGGMQDFINTTDYEATAIGRIQDAVNDGTALDVYDILDTLTSRITRIRVTTKPDETFRVVLKVIPEKGSENYNLVWALVKNTLKIPLLEARNYVEALPSFVGQGLSQANADALAAEFVKLEATAVVEKE